MEIQQMLEQKTSKLWCKFVFASIVGVLFTTIYVMVDGIFIGQGVGELGVAAINLVWPAVTIVLGLGLMIGTGSSTLLAIALGKGDQKRAQEILSTCLVMIFCSAILITVVGLLFANPLVTLMGAKNDTFQYTKDYHVVIFIMALPYLLSTSLTMLVRTDGSPNLSMILVSLGAICNVVLDWLFIMVFQWGMFGAALATGAGVILSSVVGLWYFTKGNARIKFRFDAIVCPKDIIYKIITVGFASFAIQVSLGIVIYVRNLVLYRYGTTSDVAIFCIAGYISSVCSQICVGMTQGMQPLIGYYHGANLKDKVKEVMKMTIFWSIVVGVGSLLVTICFGKELILFFGMKTELLSYAYTMNLAFCFSSPIIGIIFTVIAYYQALHKNMYASIISVGRGCILQLIFTLLLPLKMGASGVFYSQPLGDLAALLLLVFVYYLDKKNQYK